MIFVVVMVVCIGRISTAGVSQTCAETMSLCPHTYATCSCTISSEDSSNISYNQWNFYNLSPGLPVCSTNINEAIQLERAGALCSNEYQKLGPFIKAWNEPDANSCNGNKTSLCETTTLLIYADPSFKNGFTFECQGGANNSYAMPTFSNRTNITIITPPDAPKITAVYSYNPTQLTVTWSPASSGSSSTSFNVGISESVSASLMYDGNREYSHTFLGLAGGTTYKVSVVAINCAGNSDPVYQSGSTDNIIKEVAIYGGSFLVVVAIAVLLGVVILYQCRRQRYCRQTEPQGGADGPRNAVHAGQPQGGADGPGNAVHTEPHGGAGGPGNDEQAEPQGGAGGPGNDEQAEPQGGADGLRNDEYAKLIPSDATPRTYDSTQAGNQNNTLPVGHGPSADEQAADIPRDQETSLPQNSANRRPTLAELPTLAKLQSFKVNGKTVRIINDVAHNWKNVCVALDLDPTGTTMITIQQQFPNKPEECSLEMFRRWLNTGCASWTSLIDVLTRSGEDALASHVKDYTDPS